MYMTGDSSTQTGDSHIVHNWRHALNITGDSHIFFDWKFTHFLTGYSYIVHGWRFITVHEWRFKHTRLVIQAYMTEDSSIHDWRFKHTQLEIHTFFWLDIHTLCMAGDSYIVHEFFLIVTVNMLESSNCLWHLKNQLSLSVSVSL